jgi:hypothetical protein
MPAVVRASLAAVAVLGFSLALIPATDAGEDTPRPSSYQVLEPITQGNLTIFPVVVAKVYDTSRFLTLDEGLRSGEVVVTETGQQPGMVRRRALPTPPPAGRADVNHLFIVNNSKRPLLLLAGEIVVGGKQDRVVAKDRIIPAGSDADLNVFCVEPGRWAEQRGVSTFSGGYAMAAPTVRNEAMAKKSQQGVWDSGNRSNEVMATMSPGVGVGAGGGSYARVMENDEVRKEVDKVAAPMERSYQGAIGALRERKAVGVVVAINGQIIWADIFASPALLEKYWPKLVRSYAAEAMITASHRGSPDLKDAQAFLARLDGRHEQADTEPGVYRHTEITGNGYKVFELTSLLPGTGFDVHLSKMLE